MKKYQYKVVELWTADPMSDDHDPAELLNTAGADGWKVIHVADTGPIAGLRKVLMGKETEGEEL